DRLDRDLATRAARSRGGAARRDVVGLGRRWFGRRRLGGAARGDGSRSLWRCGRRRRRGRRRGPAPAGPRRLPPVPPARPGGGSGGAPAAAGLAVGDVPSSPGGATTLGATA